jgi:two-component system copper resistance phosphate regulon response regulator CusR
MHLLIVEDDTKLARALRRGLERDGFTVELATDGEEALSKAAAERYDVMVLDIMLPRRDGFAVLAELRRDDPRLPVLMLTARAHVRDRIRGLDAGADDYLVKPFEFGELVARLRALTRRASDPASETFSVGDLSIDPATYVATRAGRQIELTAREFAVLDRLVQDAGRVVSRAALLDAVWGEDFEGSDNIVDVYVGYLRRKLEDPFDRRLIRTIRGVGFVLESA